jgi:alpha-L-fucosidase
MTKQQSEEAAALVHQLQPDCLVSGRVGHGAGDYDSVGDNQISVGTVGRDWETPVTLNDTWGFKKNDHNWKSTSILIRQMVQVVGRGGNYLLNVGPTAEGVIPQPSVERLAEVGEWLRANSESIYGTGPSPFPYELSWGLITAKPGRLYLHVFNWPRKELVLYGLKNRVKKASLLSNGSEVKLSQNRDNARDLDSLRIQLPLVAPDKHNSVIVLEVEGNFDVETTLTQQPDQTVTLPAYMAEKHSIPGESSFRLDSRGVFERWLNKNEWLSWNFKVNYPGAYDLFVVTSEQKYGRDWEGDHQVAIEFGQQRLQGQVVNQGKEENPSNPYWKYVLSKIGRITIEKPGRYSLSLKPLSIRGEKRLGLTLVSVRLTPANK